MKRFIAIFLLLPTLAAAQTVYLTRDGSGNVVGTAPFAYNDGQESADWSSPDVMAYRNKLAAPTLYAACLRSGIVVTSTASPALNGAYPVDNAAQNAIGNILQSYAALGQFPNGGQTMPYPTTISPAFTPAQLTALAKVMGQYAYGCAAARDQTLSTGAAFIVPTNALTIP